MKRIYTITLLAITFALELSAQSGGLAFVLSGPEKQGDQLFENYAYHDALQAYKKAYEKDATNERLILKIAGSFRLLNNPLETEKWYAKIENKESTFHQEDYWHYAEALSSMGKYQEARKWYDLYRQSSGADNRVAKKIEGIENQEEIHKRNVSAVTLQTVDFNSPEADFSPAYYEDGVVFVSGRSTKNNDKRFSWDKSGFLDLHFYKKDVLSEDEFNHQINSKYHEGPLAFFDQDTKLIFTRNNYSDKIGRSSDGITKLQLYYSEKNSDADWARPEPLPFNSDEFSTGHPTMSTDGKTLYFASDMPGGYGGTDLYKVAFVEDKWQTPINLGEKINTEGDEFFPFLYQDKQLFFASNGHGGLGGLDIFGIDLSMDQEAKVLNVGAPLNSPLDDFGLILNREGTKGYISSNRPGGIGNDDLYQFTTTKSLLSSFKVSGQILSANDNIPLQGAAVSLLDDQDRMISKFETLEDGFYSFDVEPDHNYRLRAEKQDYTEVSRQFKTEDPEDAEWINNLYLVEIKSYSIYAVIQDNTSGQAIQGVQVSLIDNLTGDLVLEELTGSTGDFIYPFKGKQPKDRVSFQLKMTKEGYLGKTLTYNAALGAPGQIKLHEAMKVNLDKIDLGIDLGKIAGVQPIYFDLGKHSIRPDAAKELSKIVAVMMENPSIFIELGSHSDSRGSSASNLQLSEKRAKASADYIISQGIDPSRVISKGYGESEIKNRCVDGVKCSEQEHQQNRRTEFKVTKL